jgi:hypothetical protein
VRCGISFGRDWSSYYGVGCDSAAAHQLRPLQLALVADHLMHDGGADGEPFRRLSAHGLIQIGHERWRVGVILVLTGAPSSIQYEELPSRRQRELTGSALWRAFARGIPCSFAGML